jgi:hypothetical protein
VYVHSLQGNLQEILNLVLLSQVFAEWSWTGCLTYINSRFFFSSMKKRDLTKWTLKCIPVIKLYKFLEIFNFWGHPIATRFSYFALESMVPWKIIKNLTNYGAVSSRWPVTIQKTERMLYSLIFFYARLWKTFG